MPQYGFSLLQILPGFHPYLTSGPGDRPQGSHQAAGRCHPDTSQHSESSLPAETKLNIIDIFYHHYNSLSNLMIPRGQKPLTSLKQTSWNTELILTSPHNWSPTMNIMSHHGRNSHNLVKSLSLFDTVQDSLSFNAPYVLKPPLCPHVCVCEI